MTAAAAAPGGTMRPRALRARVANGDAASRAGRPAGPRAPLAGAAEPCAGPEPAARGEPCAPEGAPLRPGLPSAHPFPRGAPERPPRVRPPLGRPPAARAGERRPPGSGGKARELPGGAPRKAGRSLGPCGAPLGTPRPAFPVVSSHNSLRATSCTAALCWDSHSSAPAPETHQALRGR